MNKPTRTTALALWLLAFGVVATLAACGPRKVVIKSCDDHTDPAPAASEAAPSDQSEVDPGATLLEGVETFEVAGIPVILKRTPGKPVATLGLYVRGGTKNLTPQSAGIESALFALVAEGGSASLPRNDMHLALDMMGTEFGSRADREFSVYGLQAVHKNWEQSMEIFADVILHPALPEDELERQRARSIEFLKSLDENPDRYVSVLGQDLVYAGSHPYAQRHWGTIENVERFTAADLRSYHTELMVRSRLLFVVVGDLTKEEIQARAPFADLPEGSYQPEATPPFPPPGDRLATFFKDIPTSYVVGYFKTPEPGHPDYYAMVVATAMLRARLFEKVRTKLDLSYAVASGVGTMPANVGYLYATSTYPAHALNQMFDEVESMQDWLVNEKEELNDQVSVFITDTYMKLETMRAQRDLLAEAELLRGDWRQSAQFIRGVRGVTVQDIRRVMQTYVKDIQLGYYGAEDRLSKVLTGIDPADADRTMLESLGQPGPGHAEPPAASGKTQ